VAFQIFAPRLDGFLHDLRARHAALRAGAERWSRWRALIRVCADAMARSLARSGALGGSSAWKPRCLEAAAIRSFVLLLGNDMEDFCIGLFLRVERENLKGQTPKPKKSQESKFGFVWSLAVWRLRF